MFKKMLTVDWIMCFFFVFIIIFRNFFLKSQLHISLHFPELGKYGAIVGWKREHMTGSTWFFRGTWKCLYVCMSLSDVWRRWNYVTLKHIPYSIFMMDDGNNCCERENVFSYRQVFIIKKKKYWRQNLYRMSGKKMVKKSIFI